MRTLCTTLALLSLAASPALAQDPVVVDSTHYKVEFENEDVRVLRITYGPHEKSVMHSHPAGVAVFLTDLNGRFTLPDGQTMEVGGEAGQAVWVDAASHNPENLSDQPMELIQIELKEPAPTVE